MRTLAPFLAVILAACTTAPSQHDAAVYGTIRVAVGPSLDGLHSWQRDQVRAIEDGILALSALGPDVRIVSEGESDVTVRAASLGGACGRFTPGLRFVEVDATCTQGFPELRAVAAHEVMHWLTHSRYGWTGHICELPGDSRDCHPAITGTALLNPGVRMPDYDGAGTAEVWTGDYPQDVPAQADLDLIARCQRGSCL